MKTNDKVQKDTRVAARLSAEEKKALDQYAADNDMSISQIIRKALKDFLANNK